MINPWLKATPAFGKQKNAQYPESELIAARQEWEQTVVIIVMRRHNFLFTITTCLTEPYTQKKISKA